MTDPPGVPMIFRKALIDPPGVPVKALFEIELTRRAYTFIDLPYTYLHSSVCGAAMFDELLQHNEHHHGNKIMQALTQKQENFCLAFIETGNASEAYRRAYDAEKMKAETIHTKACELLSDGKVTARVEALRAFTQKRHEITVDALIIELEQARTAALNAANPQAAAAVAATMGKAKLAGLLAEKPKGIEAVTQIYLPDNGRERVSAGEFEAIARRLLAET